jgi:hypothetical protein
MTSRFATRLGIAAALTIGVASTAMAQARSQIPIKVTKDSPGEVITRVDTITVTRTDTVRVYSTDTIRVPGPTITNTNTVTRYDTVTVETLPGWMRRANGLYFGLGFGPTYSGMALVPAQSAGYDFQAQVGYDPRTNPFGVRLDLNWARPDEQQNYSMGARPEIANVSGDLKLRTPALGQRFPLSFYAVGGATYIRYKDLKVQLKTAEPGTVGDNVLLGDGRWHDQWGWNGGAGMALGWGKTELFIEARAVNFNVVNTSDARQYPIAIGFNWY